MTRFFPGLTIPVLPFAGIRTVSFRVGLGLIHKPLLTHWAPFQSETGGMMKVCPQPPNRFKGP